ncbi:conserved protein of unknown function [Methylacidimicrobium sp. AP8]|uniref:hypothetical protein n=1 Tax=Methylacidimicrobium sp. AP8 TaxID=2730359 RepID=UPI0018C15E8E|nr:hypothetical protein [Methylacidimicrobium sp. AP8]CAB4243917.1 conserved protein of unknown function [Methylacidimicrobium sp. AP8]
MAWLAFALLGWPVLSGAPAHGAQDAVLPFPELHKKIAKFGNRPRNLWTYGEFTAWGPVREGVFAASFPRLLSYTVLQKISSFSVLPTEPIVQIVICETEFPIPGLQEGRRFAIARDAPAQVLEMLQGRSFYARLRLSAPPEPLWKCNGKEAGAESAAERAEPEESADRRRRPGKAGPANHPILLHFSDIARVWKERGSHPAQTWVYGRFFVDTDAKGGLFIAHEAGLATRRTIEGLLASAAIFPFGERFDTAIFSSHLSGLRIERKAVIEIDKEHPAPVREIVPAGGLLVRLDLEERPKIEPPGGENGAKDFFSPLVRLFSP